MTTTRQNIAFLIGVIIGMIFMAELRAAYVEVPKSAVVQEPEDVLVISFEAIR